MRGTPRRLLMILLLIAPPAFLAPAATPQQVDEAIRKAKDLLLASQRDSNWEASPRRQPDPVPDAKGMIPIVGIMNSSQWGGSTALATYALLAAGENPQHEKMAAAIDWLKKADIIGTYALAMRCQVWYYLPRPDKDLMKKDRDLLLANMRQQPEFKGLYRYSAADQGYDHSASQYAVLGMWALEQRGAETPVGYWKTVEDAWLRTQDRSGGWNYGEFFRPRPPVTPSMTAAGVATLFITQDYLHAREGLECKGNISNKAIDAGLKWMVDNYEQVFRSEWPFYTLYGIERIGVAAGYKYFGKNDWYQRGADFLVKSQAPDGSWGNLPDTAFAVLFLVRGREPVVMNKLQYSFDSHGDKRIEANWNERPRDAANITRWISRQFEREFHWQIVNLDGAVDDLHDAPILYMSGNQVLNLRAADEKKLKEFVEQGGLIVGNADCAHAGFANSFKKLGTKLFPKYEFRELPAGHIVYTNHFQRSKWRGMLSVQGLSNGVRELMILFPTADPARFWQSGTYQGREELHQLIANIFLYVADRKELQYKGDSYIVRADTSIQPSKTIKVARLEHSGNWDPEPGGWRRLAAIMNNEAQISLQVEPVKLGEGKLDGFKIAHLTTGGKFKLTDAQRAQLKAFIASGGTLVADACGGGSDAATALEMEVLALGSSKPAALPPDHAVFKNLGMPAEQIGYRRFTSKATVGSLKGPRLRGVEAGGRLAIIYSPEDLSLGLVGNPVDGVIGYTPKSAVAIMRSILLSVDP